MKWFVAFLIIFEILFQFDFDFQVPTNLYKLHLYTCTCIQSFDYLNFEVMMHRVGIHCWYLEIVEIFENKPQEAF